MGPQDLPDPKFVGLGRTLVFDFKSFFFTFPVNLTSRRLLNWLVVDC